MAALDARAPRLTARQREVAALLAKGMSEKEITCDLGLSPHTTHDHVKAIYRALRVRSRGELLARLLAPSTLACAPVP